MKVPIDILDKKLRLQQGLTGKSFTLLWITSMAMTGTLLGKCSSVVMLPSGDPRIIYRQGRERKLRTLKLKPDMLVFAGQDLPLKSDMAAELGSWSGNSCLNVAGLPPQEARYFIEAHNLNPYFSGQARAKVVHHAKGDYIGTVETLLYPEVETPHAVVNRIKAKVRI